MILTILITLGSLWLLLSTAAFLFAKKTFKKYRNFPRIEVPASMEPIVRRDFGKWDEGAILRGCFLRFPLHFFMVASFLVTYGVLGSLQKYLKYPDSLIELFRSKYGRLACTIYCNLIEEFDPKEAVTTPIIIANHVNWVDFIYMGGCLPLASFVAKIEVLNVPVLRDIANYLKALYVDRSSVEGRLQTKGLIVQRARQYEREPKSSCPLIIYAQGTVTNGRSVISFKNGAFEPLSPITIYCLKYECKEFHMGFDEISIIEHAIITLCLNFTLRVFKEVVSPLAAESVEQYRERCREIVAQKTGFKKYDSDLKDIKAYETKFREAMRQRKNAGRNPPTTAAGAGAQ